mgnify:CR=1 FL=1
MIRIIYGDSFIRSARKLPSHIKQKLADLLSILSQNPFHKFLHTKYLVGELTGFFSFRVTRDWRVVFQFVEPEIIKLVKIAHRKDIYK